MLLCFIGTYEFSDELPPIWYCSWVLNYSLAQRSQLLTRPVPFLYLLLFLHLLLFLLLLLLLIQLISELANDFLNLCNHLILCYGPKSLYDLLYLTGFFDLLGEFIEEEAIIACPRYSFLTNLRQSAHSLLTPHHFLCLLLFYFTFFLKLCINLSLLCFLYNSVSVFLILPFLLLAVAQLLLLPQLLLLLFLLLPLYTRVALVGKLNELIESCALLLLMLSSLALVLVFHVAALVPILGLAGIVLVELREVAPGLEIVPVLIELVNLFHRGGTVSDVGDRFFLGEEGVPAEDWVKQLVEISLRDPNNVFLIWDAIIKRET